jgi:hypothetical protein
VVAPILGRPRLDRPLLICCHHKVGTILLKSVFRDVCRWFGWRFEVVAGTATGPAPSSDIAVLVHSRIDQLEAARHPFYAVHVRRDPREVLVSGFLYHQHTTERWCVERDAGPDWTHSPKIPRSEMYRSDGWKRRYLESLDGTSYQEALRSLPQPEGLRFEMNHRAAWTIEHMRGVHSSALVDLGIKLEDVMADFDGTFGDLFSAAGLTPLQRGAALRVARQYDLGRKSRDAVAAMPHVHDPHPERWRHYLDADLEDSFVRRFPGVVEQLGY